MRIWMHTIIMVTIQTSNIDIVSNAWLYSGFMNRIDYYNPWLIADSTLNVFI